MKARTRALLWIALAAAMTLAGCGSGGGSGDFNQATDYSVSSHWLSLPPTLHATDVFYYYPTAWQDTDNSKPRVCAIDNHSMLSGAASVFGRQATAFATIGNIYAPFYRQDNDSSINRERVIGGIPTLDGVAAFDFYIKHYNRGRPFILLGHSQGANVLANLLAGYMKKRPDVYKNMVAAYVIGYSVTASPYLSDNPHLKFAEGPDDTGVIISYNTQAPNIPRQDNPVLYAGVGLVINPITWTREETVATTVEGLGSFMPDPMTEIFGPVPQFCDAQVDIKNGVLICSSPAAATLPQPFGPGVYHPFDIPFYYFNLRANAANRLAKFLAGH